MPLITKKVAFTAAHYYWVPDWSEEENRARFGGCANRNGHGHNYQVEVTLEGPIDVETGMVMNFSQLTPIFNQVILLPLDHRHLNLEVPYFERKNPTVENLALYLWKALSAKIPDSAIQLRHLKVIENADLYAEYDGRDEVC